MNENKKFSISNMMLAFITVLVVIGLVALAGFFLLTPPDDIIMGQAEATQVRISGKRRRLVRQRRRRTLKRLKEPVNRKSRPLMRCGKRRKLD